MLVEVDLQLDLCSCGFPGLKKRCERLQLNRSKSSVGSMAGKNVGIDMLHMAVRKIGIFSCVIANFYDVDQGIRSCQPNDASHLASFEILRCGPPCDFSTRDYYLSG